LTLKTTTRFLVSAVLWTAANGWIEKAKMIIWDYQYACALSVNSFNSRLEQTTTSSAVFSKKIFFRKQQIFEHIWRKVGHIDYLNKVSSSLFQKLLSDSADDHV
jgi:hypothetical protein